MALERSNPFGPALHAAQQVDVAPGRNGLAEIGDAELGEVVQPGGRVHLPAELDQAGARQPGCELVGRHILPRQARGPVDEDVLRAGALECTELLLETVGVGAVQPIPIDEGPHLGGRLHQADQERHRGRNRKNLPAGRARAARRWDSAYEQAGEPGCEHGWKRDAFLELTELKLHHAAGQEDPDPDREQHGEPLARRPQGERQGKRGEQRQAIAQGGVLQHREAFPNRAFDGSRHGSDLLRRIALAIDVVPILKEAVFAGRPIDLLQHRGIRAPQALQNDPGPVDLAVLLPARVIAIHGTVDDLGCAQRHAESCDEGDVSTQRDRRPVAQQDGQREKEHGRQPIDADQARKGEQHPPRDGPAPGPLATRRRQMMEDRGRGQGHGRRCELGRGHQSHAQQPEAEQPQQQRDRGGRRDAHDQKRPKDQHPRDDLCPVEIDGVPREVGLKVVEGSERQTDQDMGEDQVFGR